LPAGDIIRQSFQPDSTLGDVIAFVIDQRPMLGGSLLSLVQVPNAEVLCTQQLRLINLLNINIKQPIVKAFVVEFNVYAMAYMALLWESTYDHTGCWSVITACM